MASATGLTIDDFERLPQALADNHELVDGELIKVSGNTPQHNLFRDFLTSLLRKYVEQHQLGLIISEQEFDFGGNAHEPDISFIASAKCPLINLKLRVQRFVPDLAIEIVSANDTFEMLAKKAKRYRQCGTEEVWVFSLETRQTYLYSDHRSAILDEREEFRPEPMAGFAMRIEDLLGRYLGDAVPPQ
jgi:Uma2 family endonuclease